MLLLVRSVQRVSARASACHYTHPPTSSIRHNCGLNTVSYVAETYAVPVIDTISLAAYPCLALNL